MGCSFALGFCVAVVCVEKTHKCKQPPYNHYEK